MQFIKIFVSCKIMRLFNIIFHNSLMYFDTIHCRHDIKNHFFIIILKKSLPNNLKTMTYLNFLCIRFFEILNLLFIFIL